MNVTFVMRALLRRWVFTLTGLVLALGGAIGLAVAVGPMYENKATVLLLPPKSNLAQGENPYLGLDGLEPMVDVLIRAVLSQRVSDSVAATWPGSKFTVEKDLSTSGPIFIITVDAKSPAEARAVTQSLLTEVPRSLNSLQQQLDVRDAARITSFVLTTYDTPVAVRSGQLRAGVGAAGAGVAVIVLIVAYIDRRLGQRIVTELPVRSDSREKRFKANRPRRSGSAGDVVAWDDTADDAEPGPATEPKASIQAGGGQRALAEQRR